MGLIIDKISFVAVSVVPLPLSFAMLDRLVGVNHHLLPKVLRPHVFLDRRSCLQVRVAVVNHFALNFFHQSWFLLNCQSLDCFGLLGDFWRAQIDINRFRSRHGVGLDRTVDLEIHCRSLLGKLRFVAFSSRIGRFH